MIKYKMTIAYDGTPFGGWQTQKNAPSIQSWIERCLKTILREPISIAGSGRTDAGVHALAQVAHFSCQTSFEKEKVLYSLNQILPKEIRILKIQAVSSDFHARFSALSKEYHYHLHLDAVVDPFRRLYTYHVPHPVDLELLKEASFSFIGRRDFTSFANESHNGTVEKDCVRTLKRLDVLQEDGGVRLEFEGDGFLYKMVRNITGTLLDVAQGKIAASDIGAIFQAKDRKQSGRAAPPHGLFLFNVVYDARFSEEIRA